MLCCRRSERNQRSGSSAAAVRRWASTGTGRLAYVPWWHYKLVYGEKQGFTTRQTLRFRNACPSGLCDQIPSLPPRRRSYGASPADLLQGLHRLRGGAGAAGRGGQPRTLTGELPAESVCLIARELLKRGIELRPPSPVAAHRQVLLEECAVVAVLLRRILWRRAPRWNQTLHRAAGHTAIVVAYPGLKSRACATHWGSTCQEGRSIAPRARASSKVEDWLAPVVRLALGRQGRPVEKVWRSENHRSADRFQIFRR